VKGKGLDGVHSLDDLLALEAGAAQKTALRRVHGSPVTEWLVQNGLMEQVDWYQSQTGDAEQYPVQIIERDLASGKIDVAFAWGPIAGYFARIRTRRRSAAVPLASRPGMKLDFEIAMAVRHGDKEFRQRIDQLIDANRSKIHAILANTACRCSTSRGGGPPACGEGAMSRSLQGGLAVLAAARRRRGGCPARLAGGNAAVRDRPPGADEGAGHAGVRLPQGQQRRARLQRQGAARLARARGKLSATLHFSRANTGRIFRRWKTPTATRCCSASSNTTSPK
jgi:hypothetical protein